MVRAKDLAEQQNQLQDRELVRRIVREQLIDHLEGDGFLQDLAGVVKNIASIIPHPAAQGVSKVLGALGAGHKVNTKKQSIKGDLQGEGVISDLNIPVITGIAGLFGLGHDQPKKKRVLSAKMQKRNKIMSRLMKEEGMTLPEASRYIKEQNLI
jgi:hypothetical protein